MYTIPYSTHPLKLCASLAPASPAPLAPAGISEGLLSGCCGILNESVRRQIYIVRTSGARLLALINDVMDAAALRQHRLVLKQERLELRQLVGDVSDLTRSLVDNEVALRNEVPEGMAVWADSGRIIQVRQCGAGDVVWCSSKLGKDSCTARTVCHLECAEMLQ